jgi:cytochrome P450
MIFDSLKSSAFSRSTRQYPFIERLVTPLIPKTLTTRRDAHRQMTAEKSRRRLQTETDRIDFLGPLTKPSSGVSEEEFTSNASGLILAGSETTATLLSGATFYLLKSPGSMAKLVEEVRSAFSSEDEINLVGVNGLKYMLTYLDESLRMYPPVPVGFPRKVPEGGATIGGRWVPEEVCKGSPGGSLENETLTKSSGIRQSLR